MRFIASWVFRCPFWIYLKSKYPEYDIISLEAVKKGKKAESEFKRLLKLDGKRYRYQVSMKFILDKYSIVGKADFITDNMVYEVKHVKKFRKPPKNWTGQLNLYLAMAGKDTGAIVEFNGKKFREYGMRFSEKLFDESILFFDEIYSGTYRVYKRYCGYCNYSFICSRK